MGESLYSHLHFREYLERHACSIVQVDVGRVGGITPWLKVAHMAEAFNIAVCPHFLMELHVGLCAAVANAAWVEYIPQLDEVTSSRIRVEGGYAYYNGTSMAAPHAAGVAALLLAQDATRSPAQILSLLKTHALPRSATQCPKACGAGLLNANVGNTPPPPGGVEISLAPADVPLPIGDSVQVTATVKRNGSADAGKTVTFLSSNTAVAGVAPATATTDANGSASATVSAVSQGDAILQVESQGARKAAAIKIAPKLPALPLWFVTLAALVALLLYAWHAYRRSQA